MITHGDDIDWMAVRDSWEKHAKGLEVKLKATEKKLQIARQALWDIAESGTCDTGATPQCDCDICLAIHAMKATA